MTNTQPDRADRIRGCFLAGAVGDALGAPVEFATGAMPGRLDTYGGGVGHVTDDTQMLLFTAEGLCSRCDPDALVERGRTRDALHRAYMVWLHTQGHDWVTIDRELGYGTQPPGRLVNDAALHARRAPGSTCISALRSNKYGTPDGPINDSKGCGGVMRAAPAGLVGLNTTDAFVLGCDLAAITHGHPSGYISAGALAAIINELCDGKQLSAAIATAATLAATATGGSEVAAAIAAAVQLAHTAPVPTRADVESLGGGWTGEEALAIALYCSLTCQANNIVPALVAAITHSGDSDSCGAICGNILGTIHGTGALPDRLIRGLDIYATICSTAAELAAIGKRSTHANTT